jgi:pimeloyl-ACP methyl ester carboxylesterase
MYERFVDRQPFSSWRREILEDYCRYGVLPAADGEGYDLACPPVVEASVYLGNTATDVYSVIPEVRIPVLVMRGKQRDLSERDLMDFSLSPTWEHLAEQFPDGRDLYLPHLTHFIPMQDPALVARLIAPGSAAEATAGVSTPVGKAADGVQTDAGD